MSQVQVGSLKQVAETATAMDRINSQLGSLQDVLDEVKAKASGIKCILPLPEAKEQKGGAALDASSSIQDRLNSLYNTAVEARECLRAFI